MRFLEGNNNITFYFVISSQLLSMSCTFNVKIYRNDYTFILMTTKTGLIPCLTNAKIIKSAHTKLEIDFTCIACKRSKVDDL